MELIIGIVVRSQREIDQQVPELLKIAAKKRFVQVDSQIQDLDLVPYLGGRSFECECGWHRTEFSLSPPVNHESCNNCGQAVVAWPTLDGVIYNTECPSRLKEQLRKQCKDTDTEYWEGPLFPINKD